MEEQGSPANLEHPMQVILVAWTAEDESWHRVKGTLSEAVHRVLGREMELRHPLPHDPFEGLSRRVLGASGDVRVLYCGDTLEPVEETVHHAVEEGAVKVVVCPLLLAVEERWEADRPGWRPSVRRLGQLEHAHPDVEILYAGPPFPKGRDEERLLERIREEEPGAAERLQRLVRLGFEGDWGLFHAFMQHLQSALPPETRVAMRGSAVTGVNHRTGEPFDRAGPGTSDLDLVLVGEEALTGWSEDGFYIPGALTMPLGDEDPSLAPWLEPTRRKLQRMAGRPVHVQSMSRWLLEVRRSLLGMPYLFLDA